MVHWCPSLRSSRTYGWIRNREDGARFPDERNRIFNSLTPVPETGCAEKNTQDCQAAAIHASSFKHQNVFPYFLTPDIRCRQLTQYLFELAAFDHSSLRTTHEQRQRRTTTVVRHLAPTEKSFSQDCPKRKQREVTQQAQSPPSEIAPTPRVRCPTPLRVDSM